MDPIFMIGIQRSGSNLLRLMLNQLPEVAAPHPPHILQRMMPLLPEYGDLKDDGAFHALVDDVCRLVELNPVPWEGVSFDRADIARRSPDRSLLAVHRAVYDVYAEARNARTWCTRSLANIKYMADIEAFYRKKVSYIYLYRDGRDVALSFRKAVVGEKHFYHIANEWAAAQEIALAWRRKIEPERFLSVNYEDLTGSPEATAKTVCAFLGVAYVPSMLDFHRAEEAKRTAASSDLWSNVVNPVMKDNTKKFLRDMKAEDIKIFESVAGPVLDALGYERILVKPGKEIPFTDEQIAAFDAENRRLKDEKRKLVDPADLMRGDLQEYLLKEIKMRRQRHQIVAPATPTAPDEQPRSLR
jgi:hypothetical protein